MNGRYHSDESGSVAIVFALALLPTALAVGAAIDYSRASLVKTNLQSALDAAVLAAADGSIKTSEWRVAVGKRHFKSTASVAAPPSASFTVGRDGRLNANSKGQVQLKAPTSGTYAGIVLFQSRAMSSWSAQPHIVNSDSSSYLQGSIYVPNGKIMLNSDSTLNQTATYTLVIDRTMELNSYGTFVANANYSGATPLPGAISAASARQPVLIR